MRASRPATAAPPAAHATSAGFEEEGEEEHEDGEEDREGVEDDSEGLDHEDGDRAGSAAGSVGEEEEVEEEAEAEADEKEEVEEEGESCAICLDPTGDSCKALACGHTYHTWCIRRWLQTKQQCPLCRAKTGTEETSAEERAPPSQQESVPPPPPPPDEHTGDAFLAAQSCKSHTVDCSQTVH